MINSYKFEVFFDGECPLCRKEIEFLRWMDTAQRIQFTDIAAEDFCESDIGRSFEQLMSEIHGRTASGEWITGVEVFRRLYDSIGWTWLVAPSRWPLIRDLCDVGYRWFARNRLRLTGRSLQTNKNCSEQML